MHFDQLSLPESAEHVNFKIDTFIIAKIDDSNCQGIFVCGYMSSFIKHQINQSIFDRYSRFKKQKTKLGIFNVIKFQFAEIFKCHHEQAKNPLIFPN